MKIDDTPKYRFMCNKYGTHGSRQDCASLEEALSFSNNLNSDITWWGIYKINYKKDSLQPIFIYNKECNSIKEFKFYET